MKCILMLLLIISVSSCNNRSLENCQCKQIEIYGMPNGILSPIRVTKKQVLKQKSISVTNPNSIKLLIDQMKQFETEEVGGEIDNRFVIEVVCMEGGIVQIESNNYVSRWNSLNYKPTKEFISAVSELVKAEE